MYELADAHHSCYPQALLEPVFHGLDVMIGGPHGLDGFASATKIGHTVQLAIVRPKMPDIRRFPGLRGLEHSISTRTRWYERTRKNGCADFDFARSAHRAKSA